MTDISWCKRQKRGIELIERNANLSVKYLQEAGHTLDAMQKLDGTWKVITAYYACYNALYALLMHCGVKSEIHDCSLAIMPVIGFSEDEIDFLQKLKIDRIDVQYYLKEKELKHPEEVSAFVFRCKVMLKSIDVETVRKRVENEN